MKRWAIFIAAIVGVFVLLAGGYALHLKHLFASYAAQGQPKATVSTIKVSHQDWLSSLSVVGSLRAERGADLSSEVLGIVDQIHFNSGDEVKEGQLLAHLRDGDELGQLHVLQAAAELAKINLKRDRAQLEAKAIAQATVDSDEATLKSDLAQIEQQQGVIDKKNIHAPFAGHLGIRQIDLGQYLNPGDKIVTLQTLDPIYVDFYMPQQALSEIAVGQKITASTDTFPDLSFEGNVAAIDPKVDVDTRNVQLRATLRNPDHKLLPGMFANVKLDVGSVQSYLTLPQTAVTFNPYGDTIFLVESAAKFKADSDAAASASADATKDGKSATGKDASKGAATPADDNALVARQVFVTVGATRGDQISILKGLTEGDEVVTSGQLKLKNGAAVVVDNSLQPTNDPNPKPADE